MSCDTCTHSKLRTQMGAVGLYCHRNPPTMILLTTTPGQAQMLGLWPPVDKLDSCGEYEYHAMGRSAA